MFSTLGSVLNKKKLNIYLLERQRERADYLSVKIASMMAYSMIALKILQMQVTMNLSIALRLLDPDEGALSLT